MKWYMITLAIISTALASCGNAAEPITIKNLDKVTCLINSINNKTNCHFSLGLDTGNRHTSWSTVLNPFSHLNNIPFTPPRTGAVRDTYLYIGDAHTNMVLALLGFKMVSRLQFFHLYSGKDPAQTKDLVQLNWTIYNHDQTVKDTYYWDQEIELNNEKWCNVVVDVDITTTNLEDAAVDLVTVVTP